VLTLDGEIEFIWKKRWSPLKGLFIFNRYLADAMLLSVTPAESRDAALTSARAQSQRRCLLHARCIT
jgi:hypothetical protein